MSNYSDLLKATVVLNDDTVGTLATDTPDIEGHTVTIDLRDENGKRIRKTGKVKAVLEAAGEWE